MTKITPPSPLRASDYEAIEAALLDSARGRWFLNEYARQNRTADTQMLLDAITKLEASIMRPAGKDDNQDRIRSGLIEMSESIAQTRQEISAMASSNDDSRLVTATEELDSIVDATEKATSAILEAAVVGVPDEKWGEVGCAYVLPRPGNPLPNDGDLIAYCRQHLAPYKVPRHFIGVDDFPRTAAGKIQKHLLARPPGG